MDKVRATHYPTAPSWEHVAISLAVKSAALTDGCTRLGSEYASIEAGMARCSSLEKDQLAAFASILRRHRRATAVIDAHCGASAPPRVAGEFSVQRAKIVAQQLCRLGVERERLSTRGHGKAIASGAALCSRHPNAETARAGLGWAEIFITLDGDELPERPDYYPSSHRGILPSSSSSSERDLMVKAAGGLVFPVRGTGMRPPPQLRTAVVAARGEPVEPSTSHRSALSYRQGLSCVIS